MGVWSRNHHSGRFTRLGGILSPTHKYFPRAPAQNRTSSPLPYNRIAPRIAFSTQRSSIICQRFQILWLWNFRWTCLCKCSKDPDELGVRSDVRTDFDPVDKFSMRGPIRYGYFKTWSRGSVCSSVWLTPNSPRSTAWAARHIFEPLDLEGTISHKLEKRLRHPQNGQM